MFYGLYAGVTKPTYEIYRSAFSSFTVSSLSGKRSCPIPEASDFCWHDCLQDKLAGVITKRVVALSSRYILILDPESILQHSNDLRKLEAP